MSVHDAYARLTPYELLLPDPEFPERCFGAIASEAEERGVDPGNPAAFVMLGSVGGALGELREEDAAPELAHDHAGILFFAYHFWRAGGTVALARRGTVRELLEGRRGEAGEGAGAAVGGAVGSGGARPRVPEDGLLEKETDWAANLARRAGYVQLPRHMVWVESPDDPPESMDGFFWYGDRRAALHLAVVAGMRRDRPGFVAVTVPPQPLAELPGWAAGPARESGGDFSTSLPGSELDDLVGVRTPAEIFKLAALLLGRLPTECPEAAAPAPRPTGAESPQPDDPGPPPTTLPSMVLESSGIT